MAYRRKRQPRGMNYRKSLVLRKTIKTLEQEIKETEAKIARCQLVNYDGKEHTFQPFWTRQPSAFSLQPRAFTILTDAKPDKNRFSKGAK